MALNETASAPMMPVREPCGIIHKTCLSLLPQGMPSESGHAGWPSAAPRPNCSAGAVDAAQHRHVEAGHRAAEDSAGVYAALDGAWMACKSLGTKLSGVWTNGVSTAAVHVEPLREPRERAHAAVSQHILWMRGSPDKVDREARAPERLSVSTLRARIQLKPTFGGGLGGVALPVARVSRSRSPGAMTMTSMSWPLFW